MKVYKAINQVQKSLAKTGITKDRKNQQQNYTFRGIDDVYNALSPLLAEAGLCILPRVLTRAVVERPSSKGGILFYVTVEVEFDFISAEDGSKHIVKTYGEAMDSADKATNKAMSAAYKYAALQAFAIPTEGDNDSESDTPEVDAAYKAFEDEHLHRLRGAALESVEALQKAFGAIPASPMKAKLWATHGQSLKNANKN